MPKVEDLHVNITADASQALHELERVRLEAVRLGVIPEQPQPSKWQLWWFTYGPYVLAAIGALLGFIVGLNIN